MSFSTHCFWSQVSTPYTATMKLVYRWSRFESSAAPSAMSTSQPHNGPSACRHRARRRRRPRRSVCRTPLGLMLSGVTSKEEFLSFPSSARPGKGSARPPNGGRHREQAVSYGPFIGVLTCVVKGEAGGSAVRGPHAKINCSLGDSFTGENSCMASGQLTQPALMRVRRMHPTSLKCCSPKITNNVQRIASKAGDFARGKK